MKLLTLYHRLPTINFRFLPRSKPSSSHIKSTPSRTKTDSSTVAGVLVMRALNSPVILQLGKKLPVKPLTGQYEQISKSILQQMGRASAMDRLDKTVLEQWLQLPAESSMNYPEVAPALADWILNPNRCDLKQLVAQIWGDSQS